MNVTVENGEGCRRILSISVPAEEAAKDYESILDVYVKNAKLRGFRKGRAPAALVEKQFAKSIQQELRDRVIPRSYAEAIKQEELKPVATVDVQDVEYSKDDGFKFKVVVDVEPEFKLPKYKKISLKREPVAVTDEDVENTITNIRQRSARYEDVTDQPLAANDMVQIDYEAVCDGKPLAEVAADSSDIGKGADMWVPSGEHEFVPGMTAALEGASIGDTRSFDVEFSEDYYVKAVAGLKATYTMTIKAIRKLTLPELTEEFLKQYGVKSEEELRTNIRKDLEEAGEAREKARLKDEISKYLVEKTKIEVPQSLVDRETYTLVQETIERASKQGASREMIEEQHAAIFNSASEAALSRVKLSYVVNAIRAEEGIEISDEDVDREVATIAARYGMQPEMVRAELEKRDEGLKNMRLDLLGNKVMDFLLENAKIKE